MSIPRIYAPNLILDEAASHHVARVLRCKVGDSLILFTGEGGEHSAVIQSIGKKLITVEIQAFHAIEREASLHIHLGQSLALGDRMDYAIQKCVELGVAEITPLFTERSNVKLEGERVENRLAHWRKLIISSCEQCGRNRVPILHAPITLKEWFANRVELNLILQADGTPITELAPAKNIKLTVGPEGGFSPTELTFAKTAGFEALSLGLSILRTETAGVAAIAALQAVIR